MKNKSILLTAAIAVMSTSVLFAQSNKSGKANSSSKPAEMVMTKEMQQSMTPRQALQKLKDGNNRFVSGKSMHYNYLEAAHETASGQYPSAIVLSCVDSRTSSELIFDQTMGDIFNARIAGNFVNTDILGSMEFACKVAGAKLVVVIGHNKCGAVKGACDHVELGNLTSVMNEIQPAVDNVKDIPGERNSKNEAFVEAVAKENVMLAMKEIREKSSILKEMESKGELMIVGAMYDLKTGKVEFYN